MIWSFAVVTYHCFVNLECKKESFINFKNNSFDFFVDKAILSPAELYLNLPESSGFVFVNCNIVSLFIPSLKTGEFSLIFDIFLKKWRSVSASSSASMSSRISRFLIASMDSFALFKCVSYCRDV